eukprot:scaffold246698_cov27-Tisochrysis_lutea.AAC.1
MIKTKIADTRKPHAIPIPSHTGDAMHNIVLQEDASNAAAQHPLQEQPRSESCEHVKVAFRVPHVCPAAPQLAMHVLAMRAPRRGPARLERPAAPPPFTSPRREPFHPGRGRGYLNRGRKRPHTPCAVDTPFVREGVSFVYASRPPSSHSFIRPTSQTKTGILCTGARARGSTFCSTP